MKILSNINMGGEISPTDITKSTKITNVEGVNKLIQNYTPALISGPYGTYLEPYITLRCNDDDNTEIKLLWGYRSGCTNGTTWNLPVTFKEVAYSVVNPSYYSSTSMRCTFDLRVLGDGTATLSAYNVVTESVSTDTDLVITYIIIGY